MPEASVGAFWADDVRRVVETLASSPDGLTVDEARRRLVQHGPNRLRDRARLTRARVLLNQVKNPLLLILVFAAVASAITGEWVDAAIVLSIVLATVGIGYQREYTAQTAAAALQSRIQVRTRALRGGVAASVPVEDIVPGDVVLLSAGSLVPADGVVIESNDFFVSEAVLTGESFPAEKRAGAVSASASLRDRLNCVFMGTNVRSGTARCVIVATGRATEFGAIAHRLTLQAPETEFDRGIRHFGYLLTSSMLVLVTLVFLVHMLNGRPAIETLLFAIALAVGLSPELLPAILSVNLARGAQMLAKQGVLVRRLNAIENLGSMDVLCTDKTGTLTEGIVNLEGSYDASGTPSGEPLELGAWNAALETGLDYPLDDAILKACQPRLGDGRKLAEIPFDFIRKRVSVVVELKGAVSLITKGAFHHVLETCTHLADGSRLDDGAAARLEGLYQSWSVKGIRVLAVASRPVEAKSGYSRADEQGLVFRGFLAFLDQPKIEAKAAVAALQRLGVSIKVITGDNGPVARQVAALVGLGTERVLTGAELQDMNDEALWRVAERTDLFVEVDPNQKERIILALKRMGHVVGFLGDGVNDAPAMHAADTSLSVEQAVDVARAAADFVLLRRDLDVIRRGIEEGRRTFANTMKYILTTISANLGNMLSMAAASLFLPFLPLLPGQILLNNFLSDIPAIGIADDAVDVELVEAPRRWDMRFVGRFMVEFGALSSLFDFMTFAMLLVGFRASAALFQTGWFVESLLTELVIALVVRTRRPFFKSRPGTLLLTATIVLIPLTLVLPSLPFASLLGFVPLPVPVIGAVAAVTVLYVASAELAKKWFYRVPQRAPRRL